MPCSACAVVLLVTWFFLGHRLALLTSIGVPFALAGMFLALHLMGHTLNVSVLLGVAIVLGIPLDDAVVVAEAIACVWPPAWIAWRRCRRR
jgi:multidrug efflux pump subunit AcrB